MPHFKELTTTLCVCKPISVVMPFLYNAIHFKSLEDNRERKILETTEKKTGLLNENACAARLDDAVNFIPARISAVLMIIAAAVGGKEFSAGNALRIFKRDRYNHKSPNSAQTESVCAGALSIRLAGDAYYFGQLVKKPYIGDDTRKIERADIKRANKLMYITAYLCAVFMMAPFVIYWILAAIQGFGI